MSQQPYQSPPGQQPSAAAPSGSTTSPGGPVPPSAPSSQAVVATGSTSEQAKSASSAELIGLLVLVGVGLIMLGGFVTWGRFGFRNGSAAWYAFAGVQTVLLIGVALAVGIGRKPGRRASVLATFALVLLGVGGLFGLILGLASVGFAGSVGGGFSVFVQLLGSFAVFAALVVYAIRLFKAVPGVPLFGPKVARPVVAPYGQPAPQGSAQGYGQPGPQYGQPAAQSPVRPDPVRAASARALRSARTGYGQPRRSTANPHRSRASRPTARLRTDSVRRPLTVSPRRSRTASRGRRPPRRRTGRPSTGRPTTGSVRRRPTGSPHRRGTASRHSSTASLRPRRTTHRPLRR